MIRLEYFTKDDYESLIGWINSEDLLKHWSGGLFRFPLTKKSLDWYLEDTNDMNASEAFVYKAVDNTSGATVGHISLGGLSYRHRSARINRVFVAETGKGICQEMVSKLLDIAFGEMHLHRVGLGVYDDNPAAVKCYEKCGFKTEGMHRDVLLYNKQWWSMIEMGILEHEWQALSR